MRNCNAAVRVVTASGERDSTLQETSIDRAINDAAQILGNAGIETGRLDARCLLGHILATQPAALAGRRDEVLTVEVLHRFSGLVARRAERIPVSRIIGEREFWSMSFSLSSSVLDPRPDSEALIEALLSRIKDRTAPLRLLDLGTGSGCLLAALLKELPRSTGIGVDIIADALIVARRNLIRNGLGRRAQFLCSNWTQALRDKSFDIVLANPPYIPWRNSRGLAPEVIDHDPQIALFAGSDGLAAYRTLLPDLHRVVQSKGIIALEIGTDQRSDVTSMLEGWGFTDIEFEYDLSGIERCLLARPLPRKCQDKKGLGMVALGR